MPIRENTNKRNIYRSFKVGSLLNLVMLDTRQNNRDKQIDPRNYFSSGQFDMDSFYNDLLNKEKINWGTSIKLVGRYLWQLRSRLEYPRPASLNDKIKIS